MKLCLISALLLLIPLASAKSVATILYANNGTTDFVLTDAADLYSLAYGYSKDDMHILMDSNKIDFVGMLVLKSDLMKKEKTSLVIEWTLDEGKGRSNESLKHLIRFIGHQIVLREPNEDERKRMEDYKKQQTLKSNFKMVYQQKKISAESFGLDGFRVDSKQNRGETLHSFELETYLGEKSSSFIRFKDDRETIENASFVIERQASRKERDCENDEVAGLKPWYCRGEMVFRNLD